MKIDSIKRGDAKALCAVLKMIAWSIEGNYSKISEYGLSEQSICECLGLYHQLSSLIESGTLPVAIKLTKTLKSYFDDDKKTPQT